MRAALPAALVLAVSAVALPACGTSDSPSTSTTPGAHLGSTAQTKTTETTGGAKGIVPGTKTLGDETARLKAQALQSSSMFGNSLSSIGAGLSSGSSSLQTEAGRTQLEGDLKQLEAQARQSPASTQNEQDFIEQMLQLIRDIREKLAAIQAAQGDGSAPIGRA